MFLVELQEKQSQLKYVEYIKKQCQAPLRMADTNKNALYISMIMMPPATLMENIISPELFLFIAVTPTGKIKYEYSDISSFF